MSESNGSAGFDFTDLAPASVPVRYDGKSYVLREASEAAAVRWRNANLKAVRMVDGKPAGMDGLADGEPLLVSLCLFEAGPAGERPVPLSAVLSWPSRVVKPLFEWVKEHSALDERGETAEELEKRIAEDQKRLAELRAGGGPHPNWPAASGSTASTSSSRPSTA